MKHRAAIVAIALIAAPATPPVRAEPFPAAGVLTPGMLEKIKSQLGLTTDQEARMSAILRDAEEKGSPAAATLRERHEELRQKLLDPAATAAAADDLLSQVLELEGTLKRLQVRTLFTACEMLTPEQRRQALQLAFSKPIAEPGDLESRVRAKVARLQSAVRTLGVDPTEGMKRRGEPIQAMIQEGDWRAADAALDTLIVDAGLDAPDEPVTAEDFSGHAPGDNGFDALMARLESVKERAQEVVSIPSMRRLLQARDALNEAKAAQDTVAAGRILTFAEKELAGK